MVFLESASQTLQRLSHGAIAAPGVQTLTIVKNTFELATMNFLIQFSSEPSLCMTTKELMTNCNDSVGKTYIEEFLQKNLSDIRNFNASNLNLGGIVKTYDVDKTRDSKTRVGILIRQWDAYELTRQCIEDIVKSSVPSIDNGEIEISIMVFDDASSDNSFLKLFLEFPNIQIVRSVARAEYCLAFNILAKKAIREGCSYLFIVNNDTKNFSSNCLTSMIRVAQSSANKNSIVSPIVRGFDGASFFDGKPRNFAGLQFPIATEAYLVSSEIWKSLNGFNLNLVRYCEDLDFINRALNSGAFVGADYFSDLEHLGNGSSRRQVFTPTYFFIRNLFWIQKLYGKSIYRTAVLKDVLIRRIRPEIRKALLEIIFSSRKRGYVRLIYILWGLIKGVFGKPKSKWTNTPENFLKETKSRFYFDWV
jgi:GT2 family glycosyltransferase